MRNNNFAKYGAILAVSTALAACSGSGGGSSSSNNSDTPQLIIITGLVSAPGGALALRQPTLLDQMMAAMFGKSAVAALSGTDPVPGTTVNLIEVDSTGTQVGSTIATGTTNTDGTFSVEAPSTFEPSGKYVLRVGSGTTEMDTIVTSTTDQEIDPASEAATDLILSTAAAAGASLANLDLGQIEGVQDTVAKLANDVADAGSIDGIATALTTELQNQEEATNVLDSIAADGTITGTVTDSTGAPLAGVDMVVRDFKDWVTRAKTKTNASGVYTVKVPSGSTKNYIVGALNHVSTNMAASEWWTAGGGEPGQYSADKIPVPDTTPVTKDFQLDAGAQIKGIVYQTDGVTPLGGIHILVRDFTNDMPVAITRTRPDGKYLINVRTGTYTVGTRNQTLQAYAGGVYNGPAAGSATAVTGGGGASAATPIVVNAGDTVVAKFALPAGGKVAGVVTDPGSGSALPVPGMAVRFYGGNLADDTIYGRFVEGTRTNKDGGYRIWLQPDDYIVRSRGQTATVTAATSTPVVQDFTSLVGQVNATITTDGTTPLSQVKVQVYDSTGANYIGFEGSNGDGTVTVYTPSSGNFLLELKVDGGSKTVGSAIYDGPATDADPMTAQAVAGTRLTSGQPVTFTADSTTVVDLGVLTMPAGGELTGKVTKDSVAFGNAKLQIRTSGINGGFRFVTTRTQSDGSFSISLPAGNYNTVCAFVESATNACNSTGTPPTGYFGSTSSVNVTAGQSNPDPMSPLVIDMVTH